MGGATEGLKLATEGEKLHEDAVAKAEASDDPFSPALVSAGLSGPSDDRHSFDRYCICLIRLILEPLADRQLLKPRSQWPEGAFRHWLKVVPSGHLIWSSSPGGT